LVCIVTYQFWLSRGPAAAQGLAVDHQD
jgi:hypothetical protein